MVHFQGYPPIRFSVFRLSFVSLSHRDSKPNTPSSPFFSAWRDRNFFLDFFFQYDLGLFSRQLIYIYWLVRISSFLPSALARLLCLDILDRVKPS
ncbi:hypothetical protein ACE6H2_000330 [Prunus campanulata]